MEDQDQRGQNGGDQFRQKKTRNNQAEVENEETRRKVYMAIAVPVSTYGEEIWINGTEGAIRRAEIDARKLARECMAIPWFIRNEDFARELKLNARKLARECMAIPWFIRNEDFARELKLNDLRVRAKRRRREAIERMASHPSHTVRALAQSTQ
ncbi:hypothetical protein QE152_g4325 [Popillia japonica]|uniref:Uncharacterized protein n=1 Tax=Popillia japonica TaxID=7064 RepID=A0AAW1N153_POPJA